MAQVIRVTVQQMGTDKMLELLARIRSNWVREEVNTIIADAIQPYVPKKSGALRRSRKVTYKSISWGAGIPYANYQFAGHVFGPNIPVRIYGKPGFIRGSKGRRDTGRMLGASPGIDTLYPKLVYDDNGWRKATKMNKPFQWKFGYTTPGTTYEWTKMYSGRVRATTNARITRWLKDVAKDLGR